MLGWLFGEICVSQLFCSPYYFHTFHNHLIIRDVIINLQRSNMDKLSAIEDLVNFAFGFVVALKCFCLRSVVPCVWNCCNRLISLITALKLFWKHYKEVIMVMLHVLFIILANKIVLLNYVSKRFSLSFWICMSFIYRQIFFFKLSNCC